MTKDEIATLISTIFGEIQDTREAGQKEYAHKDDNAFANFERVAERLNIPREKVLMVYVEKHIDGIHSYCDGHVSQREDVRGRIKDVIVYMCLLWGMVQERNRDAETMTSKYNEMKKYADAALTALADRKLSRDDR